MKKAMVTGGAGFIGSHICESLLADGIEVISYDNYSAGKPENLAPLRSKYGDQLIDVAGDVLNVDYLRHEMEGMDCVFHNAASKKNICMHDPRLDLQVNAEGTFNVMEAAVDLGVKKVVHASTGSVYGEPVELPQTESHSLKPLSFYGVSKLAGDRYAYMFAKQAGLDVTILRYFHVYGPRQDNGPFGGVVSIFAHNILDIKPVTIYGDGLQERSFTYVKDVVRINRMVAELPGHGEVYNCASGISVTIEELARELMALADIEVPIIYTHPLEGDIQHFCMDPSKVKSLGFEFEMPFTEGLKHVLDYEGVRTR